eukprot:gene10339-biopygen10655
MCVCRHCRRRRRRRRRHRPGVKFPEGDDEDGAAAAGSEDDDEEAAEGVAEAKLLTVEPSSDPRWSDRAPLMPAGRQLCGRNGLRLENTCLWLGEAGARAPLPMMTAADQTGHPDAAAHHGAGAESLCEGYLSKPPDLNRILPRTPLNQGCRVPDPVCLEVGDELAQGAAHAWRESGRCRAVSERPRAPTK